MCKILGHRHPRAIATWTNLEKARRFQRSMSKKDFNEILHIREDSSRLLLGGEFVINALPPPSDVKGKFVSATDPQDVGDIMNSNDPAVASARKSAEKYLGREMSDEEWTALMKVTAAEEADTKAMAWVMAAILNRTNRGTWGNSVVSVVSAPYQFEPVTGASGKEKRLNTLPIPSGRKLNAILVGAKEILPSVPNKIVNFTSNIDAAYKGRASISYKDKLLAKGGEVVVVAQQWPCWLSTVLAFLWCIFFLEPSSSFSST